MSRNEWLKLRSFLSSLINISSCACVYPFQTAEHFLLFCPNCHHHQSLNREGRWGTTDRWFRNQFSPVFPVLHCPLGLAELQAPVHFLMFVFPPLPLSALSSSPFHCALQDGFGQTWWTGNMTIPLQFASFYDRQEIFMWSYCLLNLGTDFLVGNMVFVWNV